jgi:hypothetical protein
LCVNVLGKSVRRHVGPSSSLLAAFGGYIRAFGGGGETR